MTSPTAQVKPLAAARDSSPEAANSELLTHQSVSARSTMTGVMWTSAAEIALQVLRFVVLLILARLLTPTAFGLVAMILVFTGFLVIFVDSGLGAALVQRSDLTERHLSSAFWVTIAAGAALTVLVAALAPALAALYGEPALLSLTLAASLTFLISSPAVVQLALLQRAMNFRRIAVIEIVAAGLGAVAALVAAFGGLGVWSLIVQTVVQVTLRSALAWIASDWRPRFAVDRSAIRELWGFSAPLAGFTAINYWIRNADNFLIGKFVGASGLGIYGRAYQIMLLPSAQVTSVVEKVMFPAMSSIQDDPARMKRAYLRTVALVALIAFPLAVGLFVSAQPFILTLLGEQWLAVVPVLQILCLPALTQSIGGTVGLIYAGCGRTDWMFRWGLAASGLTLVAFGIGIAWGVIGVATALAVQTVVLMYPNFAIPGKLIGMKFTEVISCVKEISFASAIMGVAVWALNAVLPEHWAAPALLAAETATGAIVYAAIIYFLHPPAVTDFRELILKRMRPSRRLGSNALASEAARAS